MSMKTNEITLTISAIFELAKIVQLIAPETQLGDALLSDEDADTEYTLYSNDEGMLVRDDNDSLRRYRCVAYLTDRHEEGAIPIGKELPA